MPELYHAILHPNGPNYESWQKIFSDARVPLKSPQSAKATLGEEKDVEVYLLNLNAMTLKQRAMLFGSIAQRFGQPIYEVESEIEKSGFPIRAADVIVSIDARAFV